MNEPQPSRRRILSVVGPHSGSGKTTFVIHLLRSMQPIGCLKISPIHGQPCDTGSAKLPDPDYYLEDAAQLNEPGKDTAEYFAAGAVHVERLRHRNAGLAGGLDAALQRYEPDLPVVIESSGAVRLLDPVAVILVVLPPIREMKPGTKAILPRVTDLLVNGPAGVDTTDTADRLRCEFPNLSPEYVWFADLVSEPPPNAMLLRLRDLLRPPM